MKNMKTYSGYVLVWAIHSVKDFINVDKNVYTNNYDVNVLIYDHSNLSDSENRGIYKGGCGVRSPHRPF
jgi:hypothetical protein